MAKSWREAQCNLMPDYKGLMWDALLYVPTVAFLLLWGLKMWYSPDDQLIGYGLMFLGFFFLMVGGGRMLRRMLLMPTVPVALDVNKERIAMRLKNGEQGLLMRDIRFFSDHAGKSFGLTGINERGAKQQYVFHKGQFTEADYAALTKALEVYK